LRSASTSKATAIRKNIVAASFRRLALDGQERLSGKTIVERGRRADEAMP
jgi:hypothetical protein